MSNRNDPIKLMGSNDDDDNVTGVTVTSSSRLTHDTKQIRDKSSSYAMIATGTIRWVLDEKRNNKYQ